MDFTIDRVKKLAENEQTGHTIPRTTATRYNLQVRWKSTLVVDCWMDTVQEARYLLALFRLALEQQNPQSFARTKVHVLPLITAIVLRLPWCEVHHHLHMHLLLTAKQAN